MSESPDLTFLFTDIEGSTSKWEEQPERMAHAIAGHDTLLRHAVQQHDGRIVKTTGDGIYAAFNAPADAMAAVVAIQIGLLDPIATGGMELRVRCGMHTGPVHARDNDYYGGTINRTARIMNAAHGGQILVSRAVAEQLQDSLPADVSLKELGSVRLRGLATSETVFQVVHPKLHDNFPALRELEATPNNLPQQLTSFIGRERERSEVEEMLTSTRLLTLLGMGGLGKTRLSLQIGASVMESYPDGVWFIDLQTIRDGSLVCGETARVLGVREEPGRPLMQTLCVHLKTRKLMIILDNCEQVIEASAELANAILRSSRDVRILTTSRIALRVPGEQTYVVQPLPVPSRSSGIEALMRSTAVVLFVERAKLHKPNFRLTEKEAPAVAELVSRLEGIPLALELAAARVRSLPVADINKRLNDRYKILTGGDRTLQARQQTLRALVDWSFDLLEDNEQALLARLSVFAGTLDLAAAETICGFDPLAPEDVLDIITSLVEKSLIYMEEGDEGARYRLLETIRDYAREKLTMRGESEATLAAHCNFFFTMAKAANRESVGAEQAQWTQRIETELDNLRAAIALAFAGGVDQHVAVKIEVAMMWFRMLRGYASEGRRNIQTALALAAVQTSDWIHGHALYVGATLAYSQGDYAEAKEMLERCLEIRKRDGKAAEIAATLSTLGMVRLNLGEAEGARDLATEAVARLHEQGDRTNESIVLFQLGQIHAYVGNDSDARALFEECLEFFLALEYPELVCECELSLGRLALEANDIETAQATFERAMEIARGAGDKRCEALAHSWLGRAALAAGRLDDARANIVSALLAFERFDMFAELLECLDDEAGLLHACARDLDAARLYAAAETARKRLSLPRPPRMQVRWADAVAALKTALGDADFERGWTAGEKWEPREAARWAQSEEAATSPRQEALAA